MGSSRTETQQDWGKEKGNGERWTLKSDIEDQADVLHVGACQVFENGNEIEQFVVVRVREPAADRNRVLRVEDVRRRRIVDDDGVLQIAAHLRQVLHVVTLMVVAALPEEPVVDNLVDVQLIKERVAVLNARVSMEESLCERHGSCPYLRHRRREDDNLVEFADPLHELIHTRALDDIDVVVSALDLHGYCEVGLVKDLRRVSAAPFETGRPGCLP